MIPCRATFPCKIPSRATFPCTGMPGVARMRFDGDLDPASWEGPERRPGEFDNDVTFLVIEGSAFFALSS